jgi:hypothetical protein
MTFLVAVNWPLMAALDEARSDALMVAFPVAAKELEATREPLTV